MSLPSGTKLLCVKPLENLDGSPRAFPPEVWVINKVSASITGDPGYFIERADRRTFILERRIGTCFEVLE